MDSQEYDWLIKQVFLQVSHRNTAQCSGCHPILGARSSDGRHGSPASLVFFFLVYGRTIRGVVLRLGICGDSIRLKSATTKAISLHDYTQGVLLTHKMYSSTPQDLTGQVKKTQTDYFAFGASAEIWLGEWLVGCSKRIVLSKCIAFPQSNTD